MEGKAYNNFREGSGRRTNFQTVKHRYVSITGAQKTARPLIARAGERGGGTGGRGQLMCVRDVECRANMLSVKQRLPYVGS
jgi:hypothetical protein